MGTLEKDILQLRARQAMLSFNRQVFQPGAYSVRKTETAVEGGEPTKRFAAPPARFLPAPVAEPAKPPVRPNPLVETKPVIEEKPSTPREPSGDFADMMEAMQTFEKRQELKYEDRVQADALLSRAFRFSMLMD